MNGSANTTSRLLHIRDKRNGYVYLIDTGAVISVIPPSIEDRKNTYKSSLTAANGSSIKVYGEKILDVNIGLRRSFTWTFIVADVEKAILGADFLYHNDLTVKLSDKSIIDNKTKLSVRGSFEIVHAIRRITSISHNKKFDDLLIKYSDLTSPVQGTSSVATVKHFIDTKGTPCHYKPRPLALKHQQPVKLALDKLLKEGIIRPSRSEWASPLHIVPKKNDSWRIVGDYRHLNSVTVKDTYALPYLQDFSSNLNGKKVFSKIDLRDAFLQIPINEVDIPKTCIATSMGSFEYTRMPFGLCGASQTFQRYIDSILWNLQTSNSTPRNITCFSYIDDILIASSNDEEHYEDLEALLQRLSEHGLKLNILKCEIGCHTLEFLGHRITAEGISPLSDKTEVIRNFTRPQQVNGLRRYTGMLNFYRRFTCRAAEKLAPLYGLIAKHSKLKKNATLIWDDESIKAFNDSKQLLSEETLLTHPSPNGELCIASDASSTAVGAALQQTIDGITKPLAFFSRKLDKTQQKYSTFGRELLGIYLAVKHFKRYIDGRTLIIQTDHKPIVGAMHKMNRDINRETRQLQFISQFTSDIRHISGPSNKVADALSRTDIEENNEMSNFNSTTTKSNLSISALFMHQLEDEIMSEQNNDDELKNLIADNSKSSLHLQKQNNVYGEMIGSSMKPYVPAKLRRKVFNELHNCSHPGARATLQLIRSRFVWPSMNKNVKEWCRTCLPCQKSKIIRHNKPQIHVIPTTGEKFDSINIDLVGPLPSNKGYSYLLTIVDRYSRWCEAIPILDATASTVSDALITNWISRFGVPVSITSDRGTNFESNLFQSLMKTLGSIKLRTTAYNPKCNGLVERLHRRLKEALKSTSLTSPTDWIDRLPLILLSLRTSMREDNQPSPAEITYGTNLRLPIDLLIKNDDAILDVRQYTDRLVRNMQDVGPIITRPNSRKSYVDPNLEICEYVLVRNENRRGLNPVYSGPFKVIDRHAKYFKIAFPNRTDTVSIERLKVAHTENDVLTKVISKPQRIIKLPSNPIVTKPMVTPPENSAGNLQNDATTNGASSPNSISNKTSKTVTFKQPQNCYRYITRAGRSINKPKRFSNMNSLFLNEPLLLCY